MYTLVDFITHVKGVEYILSILAITGFLVLWEVLKPAPFRSVAETGKDDLAHIRRTGYGNILRSVGKLVAAPFIGLAYLIMLPIGFAAMVTLGAFNVVLKGANGLLGLMGTSISFEWRPLEAYFTGKKRQKAGVPEKE